MIRRHFLRALIGAPFAAKAVERIIAASNKPKSAQVRAYIPAMTSAFASEMPIYSASGSTIGVVVMPWHRTGDWIAYNPERPNIEELQEFERILK